MRGNRFSLRIILGAFIAGLVILFSLMALGQTLLDQTGISGVKLLEDPEQIFNSPEGHVMGLDASDRDMLSRIAYSMATFSRTSLLVIATAFSFGILLGAGEPYCHKVAAESVKLRHLSVLGNIIGSLSQIIASFPQIVVIILLWKCFGEMKISITMVAFGIFNIPKIGQKVNAKVHSLLTEGFTESARALGVSPISILGKHLLWYQMRYVFLAEAAYIMAEVILFETSVSFLGYGTREVTLGNMLAKIDLNPLIGKVPWTELITRFFTDARLWSSFTFPTMVVLSTMLGFYLLADGLKDNIILHKKS